jgi:hypothetical protein
MVFITGFLIAVGILSTFRPPPPQEARYNERRSIEPNLTKKTVGDTNRIEVKIA